MDKKDNYLNRSNLQQITSFLISGEELIKTTSDDYDSRLKKANQNMEDNLKQFHDEQSSEYDDILCLANVYTSDIQSISFEMGLQCGAKLILNLLGKSIDELP